MPSTQILLWGGFRLFILIMLALLFNVGVMLFHPRGQEAGLEFLTGFLVEKSFSIDNILAVILVLVKGRMVGDGRQIALD